MFDTTLLESRKSRRFRGRGAGFPLAVAAHALLIGAFVGASAWSVGEPEEPETRIAVVPTFSPPPPPPPLPGGGEQVPTHAPPPRRDDDPQPPAFLPPDLSVSGSEVPSTGPGESGSETEGPGSPFGTPGGTGEVPSVGPPGESDVILRPGGDVTAPVLLSRVDPVYPEAARCARLEGTLILEAVITAAGDVQDVRVLKSVQSAARRLGCASRAPVALPAGDVERPRRARVSDGHGEIQLERLTPFRPLTPAPGP